MLLQRLGNLFSNMNDIPWELLYRGGAIRSALDLKDPGLLIHSSLITPTLSESSG